MAFINIFAEFVEDATVARLQKTAGKKAAANNGTIKVVIQPLSQDDYVLIDGEFATGVKAYTELSSDVRKSDKITHNGTDYRIRSVLDYDNKFWGVKHKKLIMETI